MTSFLLLEWQHCTSIMSQTLVHSVHLLEPVRVFAPPNPPYLPCSCEQRRCDSVKPCGRSKSKMAAGEGRVFEKSSNGMFICRWQDAQLPRRRSGQFVSVAGSVWSSPPVVSALRSCPSAARCSDIVDFINSQALAGSQQAASYPRKSAPLSTAAETPARQQGAHSWCCFLDLRVCVCVLAFLNQVCLLQGFSDRIRSYLTV